MATRYISASERAVILAQGLVRYANMMDCPANKSMAHDSWHEWEKVWGEKMSKQVKDIHDQNFTWATNYTGK